MSTMIAEGTAAQFVFGYGSLFGRSSHRGQARVGPARLDGFRRAWNVAMDNTVDLPGYKYYRDRRGRRPPVFVTFLNLLPAEDHAVNGGVFSVTERDLLELDARERNYERVEVTAMVQGAPAGTVWTYLGTAAARARHERGQIAARAVISREYHDRVLRGFASFGARVLAEYAATTDPPACPIRELQRVDLA